MDHLYDIPMSATGHLDKGMEYVSETSGYTFT